MSTSSSVTSGHYGNETASNAGATAVDQQDMTMPEPPRPKRTVWALTAVLALVLIVTAGALLSINREDPPSAASTSTVKTTTTTTTSNTPAAITRSEVMKRYAEINPLDRTATPATVDAIAVHVCIMLRDGTSTDAVITTMTDIYRARATELAQLLVSYECPGYLAGFK